MCIDSFPGQPPSQEAEPQGPQVGPAFGPSVLPPPVQYKHQQVLPYFAQALLRLLFRVPLLRPEPTQLPVSSQLHPFHIVLTH